MAATKPSTVIASEAKQSMYPRVPARMDCFVASLLAMTEEAAGSVVAHPTTRHPEVAAASAALEGRRPGSVILRGSQGLAPQDDDPDARVRTWLGLNAEAA
jgi:hypothetical protein